MAGQRAFLRQHDQLGVLGRFRIRVVHQEATFHRKRVLVQTGRNLTGDDIHMSMNIYGYLLGNL